MSWIYETRRKCKQEGKGFQLTYFISTTANDYVCQRAKIIPMRRYEGIKVRVVAYDEQGSFLC